MNVLFICSLNHIRSLTAEQLFCAYPNLHVKSAGTQQNARVVVNPKLLTWADKIFVMERHHKEKIEASFPYAVKDKTVFVLDIPNGFGYMDPELIDMLKSEVDSYL